MKRVRSGMQYVLITYCGITVPLSSWRSVRHHNIHVHNSLRSYVWLHSLKTLRGKPAEIRLGKVQENLEKHFPRSLVFLWYERLRGIGAQVMMELVHMHEGLVRFVASIH